MYHPQPLYFPFIFSKSNTITKTKKKIYPSVPSSRQELETSQTRVSSHDQQTMATFRQVVSFLKKWAILGLFFCFFSLFKQTLQFYQQINVKMSNQYMVMGIEPTPFRKQVSSHNHQNRAPALLSRKLSFVRFQLYLGAQQAPTFLLSL